MIAPPKRNHHKKPENKGFAAIPATHNCPKCGVIMGNHPRCVACGILLGRGHEDRALLDGMCRGCVDHRTRLRAWLKKGWRAPETETQQNQFYQDALEWVKGRRKCCTKRSRIEGSQPRLPLVV